MGESLTLCAVTEVNEMVTCVLGSATCERFLDCAATRRSDIAEINLMIVLWKLVVSVSL